MSNLIKKLLGHYSNDRARLANGQYIDVASTAVIPPGTGIGGVPTDVCTAMPMLGPLAGWDGMQADVVNGVYDITGVSQNQVLFPINAGGVNGIYAFLEAEGFPIHMGAAAVNKGWPMALTYAYTWSEVVVAMEFNSLKAVLPPGFKVRLMMWQFDVDAGANASLMIQPNDNPATWNTIRLTKASQEVELATVIPSANTKLSCRVAPNLSALLTHYGDPATMLRNNRSYTFIAFAVTDGTVIDRFEQYIGGEMGILANQFNFRTNNPVTWS